MRRASAMLSGGEAIARVLAEQEVRNALAYPGTSELALCNAIAQLKKTELINGRGDGTCVFIAGGCNLVRPGTAVAILHAARGLTNALGAVANLRRNEIGLLCLVGMPSTTSARYQPPHGEPGLIPNAGRFAKAAFEIPGDVAVNKDNSLDPAAFIKTARRALALAQTAPAGPVLLGIAQDILEKRWIAEDALSDGSLSHLPQCPFPKAEVEAAADLLRQARSPILFVDDVLFRAAGNKQRLAKLSQTVGAPILSVSYRRGPMLFDRMTPSPFVVGPYLPEVAEQKDLLHSTDLLVTIEDRNLTPRIVGELPACSRIAITSHAQMTAKNGYLRSGDLLIEADVAVALETLAGICARNPRLFDARQLESTCTRLRHLATQWQRDQMSPHPFRRHTTRTIGQALSKLNDPWLIDDSQMFGGLISEWYDDLPANGLRLFHDHAGFVGAGLGIAVGAALKRGEHGVWCLVGDQGFTNGAQALVCAGELQLPVVVILCNNGGSVSLRKQSRAIEAGGLDDEGQPLLQNARNLNYCGFAGAMGLRTERVDLRATDARWADDCWGQLASALESAVAHDGPTLLEVVTPPDLSAWQGIWLTNGFDEATRTG